MPCAVLPTAFFIIAYLITRLWFDVNEGRFERRGSHFDGRGVGFFNRNPHVIRAVDGGDVRRNAIVFQKLRDLMNKCFTRWMISDADFHVRYFFKKLIISCFY